MVSKNRRDDILLAANRIFLQSGYRQASMTQVAEEAGISRQALYLAFPSKQQLFSAVIAQLNQAELTEIRGTLKTVATPADKLLAALDVWCVRNYELIHSSTEATELYRSTFEFANRTANNSAREFDAILAEIIEPLLQGKAHVAFTPIELARLISTASVGFKVTATGADELHRSLRVLVSAILRSLGQIA